jgi:hypothetical protein
VGLMTPRIRYAVLAVRHRALRSGREEDGGSGGMDHRGPQPGARSLCPRMMMMMTSGLCVMGARAPRAREEAGLLVTMTSQIRMGITVDSIVLRCI